MIPPKLEFSTLYQHSISSVYKDH